MEFHLSWRSHWRIGNDKPLERPNCIHRVFFLCLLIRRGYNSIVFQRSQRLAQSWDVKFKAESVQPISQWGCDAFVVQVSNIVSACLRKLPAQARAKKGAERIFWVSCKFSAGLKRQAVGDPSHSYMTAQVMQATPAVHLDGAVLKQ